MREQKNVSALWLSGSCSFDTVGGLVIIKNVPVMVKLTAISLLLFSVKQHGVVKETLGGEMLPQVANIVQPSCVA